MWGGRVYLGGACGFVQLLSRPHVTGGGDVIITIISFYQHFNYFFVWQHHRCCDDCGRRRLPSEGHFSS